MKPDYIKHQELSQGILSELFFPTVLVDLIKFFDSKKTKRVYESSGLSEKDQIVWYEVVYVTNHPFYIHVKPLTDSSSTLTLYYKPDQLNELIVFIRIILKQIDNATTNNI